MWFDAIPVWSGCCSAADWARLEGFLKRCKQRGFYDQEMPSIAKIFGDTDNTFFAGILNNYIALLWQRGRAMLFVCLVSFNSTIRRVQSFIISYYLAIQRSVAFGVILSLLFVCLFFCLYGWGYLNAGWCDRREISQQTPGTGTR